MSKRTLVLLALGGLGLAATLPVSAVTISLVPAAADVVPGQIIALDLVISGLGLGTAPSVGDFDIDLGFDPAALQFTNYVLGEALGNPGTFEALDVSFGEFGAGGVNVAEVSLLDAAVLDATQPDTFVLATLAFLVTGLGAGDATTVSVDLVYALGDALGDPIAVDASGDAVLTGVAVALPSALWLLASGLLLLRRPQAMVVSA
jgi:hypothetical protein